MWVRRVHNQTSHFTGEGLEILTAWLAKDYTASQSREPDHCHCAVPGWLTGASRVIEASGCSCGACFFHPFSRCLVPVLKNPVAQSSQTVQARTRALGFSPIIVLSQLSECGQWVVSDVHSFCPAVWTSSPAYKQATLFLLLWPLHMLVPLPWIPFSTLINPIYPGFRWNIT